MPRRSSSKSSTSSWGNIGNPNVDKLIKQINDFINNEPEDSPASLEAFDHLMIALSILVEYSSNL